MEDRGPIGIVTAYGSRAVKPPKPSIWRKEMADTKKPAPATKKPEPSKKPAPAADKKAGKK